MIYLEAIQNCTKCSDITLNNIGNFNLTDIWHHLHLQEKQLSAQYWGELWPNSPTYARFPNLLYTAELLCIIQNKNKVLPPYVNSPCHKVAHAGNSTSSFSISAILHSCMLGYSCFLSANILIIP